MDFCTERYSTVHYSTVRFSTVSYNAVGYSAVRYSTVYCSPAKCSTQQRSSCVSDNREDLLVISFSFQHLYMESVVCAVMTAL